MTDPWKAFATRFTADVQAVKRAVRFDETVQAGAEMLHDWFQREQTGQTEDSSQSKDSSHTTSQTKESSSSIAAFHRPPR
jgi:hypothetical protein